MVREDPEIHQELEDGTLITSPWLAISHFSSSNNEVVIWQMELWAHNQDLFNQQRIV